MTSPLPDAASTENTRLSRQDWITLLVAFGIGTVLSFWRVWDRLVNAGLFAEDGLIFYLQADLIGPGAIFRPYAGYLHFIPRLGAWVISPLGLAAAPLGYALITTVLTIAGFSLVLTRRLDRFIPTVWGRGLAFIMLCLVPPFWESATALAYLIFIGGVPLVLIGLSRSPTTWWGRVLEGAAVAALGLSGPLIVFYSPLFAYRWLRDRSWANVALAAVAGVTALIQILVYRGEERATGNFGFEFVPRAYLQRIAGELVAAPDTAQAAFDERNFLWLLILLFFAVVIAIAVIEVRWDAVVALGVTGFAFAWAIRTYGIALIEPDNGNRHMLVPAAILLVVMVAALAHAVQRSLASTGHQHWLHGTLAVLAGLALLCTAGGIRAGFVLTQWSHIPTHEELLDFQTCVDEGRRDCAPVLIAPGEYRIDVNHPYDPDPY